MIKKIIKKIKELLKELDKWLEEDDYPPEPKAPRL